MVLSRSFSQGVEWVRGSASRVAHAPAGGTRNWQVSVHFHWMLECPHNRVVVGFPQI